MFSYGSCSQFRIETRYTRLGSITLNNAENDCFLNASLSQRKVRTI